tara:strand:+ start:869 stop:1441 length:573 start_codon:yes stop_codon:yes gene_type:complete
MSSKLGVENIAHTNGTVACTITSDGTLYATNQVIQIVHAGTGAYYLSDGNNWKEYLSASITPKSSNSKILVEHTVWYGGNSNGYGAGKVGRTITGGSEVALRYADANLSDNRFTDASFPMMTLQNGQYKFYMSSFSFEDTPSTTSAITYKCYTKEDAAGTDITINRQYTNPGLGYTTPSPTFIKLTEIGG